MRIDQSKHDREQNKIKNHRILFRVSVSFVVIVIAIIANYFIYMYKHVWFTSNNEGENNTPYRLHGENDQERIIKPKVVDYSNIHESDETENNGQLKSLCTNSLPEISVETLSKTQENVLSEMENVKQQVKELFVRHELHIVNNTKPSEFGEHVRTLRKDIYARQESLTDNFDSRLFNMSTVFTNIYFETKDEVQKINNSLIRLKMETDKNRNETHHSFVELRKQDSDLQVHFQKLGEEILNIQEELENTNSRIDELRALVENRIYPNTINKSQAVYTFLIILIVITFLIFVIYCKICASNTTVTVLKEELRKLEHAQTNQEHAQTNQMRNLNSKLDALMRELDTMKQLGTNDGNDVKGNEVSGRKNN